MQETNKNTVSSFFLNPAHILLAQVPQAGTELHSVAKWCGTVPRSLEYDLWDQNSILDLQLLAK